MMINKLKIEKCSESIGMICVFVFFALVLIKFHPQIIDSLFAINILLVNFIILIVGSKPAIPGIAEIVNSDFLKVFILSKSFKIFVL